MTIQEEIVNVVTAYESGGRDSLVVSIPKVLRDRGIIKPGQRFLVKIDAKGRVIYEPLGE
jgi:hypothetical protein